MSELFDSHDPSNPAYYRPSQTALLLLDFHNILVEKFGGPAAPAALDTAARLRTWAKSCGMVVIHALIDTNASPPPTAKGAERLTRIVATMKDRDGEEAPVLLQDTDSNDHTFRRTPGYISALQSPGLLDFLRRSGIKSLIMAGLSTSGCVLRTAVPATEEDFVVTVVSDACADPVDGNHDFLIERILLSRAHVLTASQVLDGYTNPTNA
jgi:nicotinamidase-related amidase